MNDTRYSAYDAFAWVYNERWSRFAKRFLPDVEELVLRHLPRPARILDLCCGTGNLAALLSEHGYEVVGVDGSKEMLEFARQNAPKAEFRLADARSFAVSGRVHAVLSMYDSLNHLMSMDDLGLVFRNVSAALEPQGLFLFDMNMEEGFEKRWNGKTFAIVEDDLVCANKSSYDSVGRVAKTEFAIFRRADGWVRADVIIFQRCYTQDEIIAQLEKAGLDCTCALDAAKDTAFRDIGRTFFLAKKR